MIFLSYYLSLKIWLLQGKEINGNGETGALCMKTPWPGMARTIFGDHQRFLDTYYRPYPGLYFFVLVTGQFVVNLLCLFFQLKIYMYLIIMHVAIYALLMG